MKVISINGRIPEGALIVEDPDVRKTFTDASGQVRHVRSFSDPVRLKAYLKRHPEGMILAGVGTFFFAEPVPVSAAMVSFDDSGSACITLKEGSAEIEKQLRAVEAIHEAAEEELMHPGEALS